MEKVASGSDLNPSSYPEINPSHLGAFSAAGMVMLLDVPVSLTTLQSECPTNSLQRPG